MNLFYEKTDIPGHPYYAQIGSLCAYFGELPRSSSSRFINVIIIIIVIIIVEVAEWCN